MENITKEPATEYAVDVEIDLIIDRKKFVQVSYDFYYYLNAPLKRDKISLKFFINDIKELKFQLEEHFGVEITDKKLYEAINLTNEIRKLLKKISEYRNK
ncbi:unnamed protein product, partial [marine sediment metagenome]